MKKILLISIVTAMFILFGAKSAKALSVEVQIPEKYNDVEAGERLYFQIDVKYPENPTRIDLRLNYAINKDGELIVESKVLKAVETQASFMDFLVLPESADSGLHKVDVMIQDYGDLSEQVGASFQVKSTGTDRLNLYFIIVMSSIGFLALLVGYDMFKRRRRRQDV